jgi:hypothetical protein
MVVATQDVARCDVKNAGAGTRVFLKILAVIFLVVGLQLNGQPAHAGADGGGFTVFDVPGSTCLPAFTSTFAFPCTVANAMNPSEVITGTYQDAIGAFHGYVRYRDGSFTKFDVPGASCPFEGYACADPTGINPEGAITGSYSDVNNEPHGFPRGSDGNITPFDGPLGRNGFAATFPTAINPEGAITGNYSSGQCPDPPSQYCGFLRAPDGTFTSFFPPSGAHFINPTAINPEGTITAWYTDAFTNNTQGTFHSFVRTRDGTFTSFDAPGAGTGVFFGTVALGINPEGTITGYYVDVNGVFHGFLRSRDGTFTSIDYPGTTGGTSAVAINPEGTITGFYPNAAGAFPGFVRTRQGTFTSFFPPDSNSIGPFPTAIIPSGAIAGYFTDTSNLGHSFLRMP